MDILCYFYGIHFFNKIAGRPLSSKALEQEAEALLPSVFQLVRKEKGKGKASGRLWGPRPFSTCGGLFENRLKNFVETRALVQIKALLEPLALAGFAGPGIGLGLVQFNPHFFDWAQIEY